MALRIRLIWVKGVHLRHVFLVSCGQQPWQSGEVVGGHRKDKAGPNPFDTTIDGLGHAADRLGPAEGFFDPLAVLDRQGIALVSGGPAVDR